MDFFFREIFYQCWIKINGVLWSLYAVWEKEKQKKFDIEGKKLDFRNWILL